MSSYQLYTIMGLILVIAILMPEAQHIPLDENEKRQYCGKSLSDTLKMICDSVYNSRFKKSNQEMEMDDYMAYSYDVHPYKSIENARKMLRFRRNTRGIYDECCLNSCSIEELRSYCGIRS